MERIAAQSAPIQEEELKKAEAKLEQLSAEPNSPEEKPMDFNGELQNIDSKTKVAEGQLSEKVKAYEDWKAKMEALRRDLGMPQKEESYPSQKAIDDVRTEIERLKEEKRITEEGKEMNDILAMLNTLPKSEIDTIIATGKTSEGRNITGPGGKKVKPEVLKKLIDLLMQGAKALLVSSFKKFLDGIEGIGNGMYETEKK
jgi:phosphoglycolate phosphatase-like HAD superfamily hydrolase